MAKVPWPMTGQTYKRYLKLGSEMTLAAQECDTLKFEQAKDQFRALPGFPPMNPDLDIAVPCPLDHKIISIGSN